MSILKRFQVCNQLATLRSYKFCFKDNQKLEYEQFQTFLNNTYIDFDNDKLKLKLQDLLLEAKIVSERNNLNNQLSQKIRDDNYMKQINDNKKINKIIIIQNALCFSIYDKVHFILKWIIQSDNGNCTFQFDKELNKIMKFYIMHNQELDAQLELQCMGQKLYKEYQNEISSILVKKIKWKIDFLSQFFFLFKINVSSGVIQQLLQICIDNNLDIRKNIYYYKLLLLQNLIPTNQLQLKFESELDTMNVFTFSNIVRYIACNNKITQYEKYKLYIQKNIDNFNLQKISFIFRFYLEADIYDKEMFLLLLQKIKRIENIRQICFKTYQYIGFISESLFYFQYFDQKFWIFYTEIMKYKSNRNFNQMNSFQNYSGLYCGKQLIHLLNKINQENLNICNNIMLNRFYNYNRYNDISQLKKIKLLFNCLGYEVIFDYFIGIQKIDFYIPNFNDIENIDIDKLQIAQKLNEDFELVEQTKDMYNQIDNKNGLLLKKRSINEDNYSEKAQLKILDTLNIQVYNITIEQNQIDNVDDFVDQLVKLQDDLKKIKK